MKFCPVVPEICRGQVHGARKERRITRTRIIIIIIIIRNGAKTISLQTLLGRLNKLNIGNRIGSVMVSVLALSAVDRGFEPRSGQTKYKIGICCFSVKHAALRSKSKDWLARNQNNVSEWSNISTHGL